MSNRTIGQSAAALLCAGLLFPGAATGQESRPAKPAKAEKATKAMKLTPGKAPTEDQQELRDKRAKKLRKPVFQHAPWMLDYDKARARAAQEEKLLLVYFTRSYAP